VKGTTAGLATALTLAAVFPAVTGLSGPCASPTPPAERPALEPSGCGLPSPKVCFDARHMLRSCTQWLLAEQVAIDGAGSATRVRKTPIPDGPGCYPIEAPRGAHTRVWAECADDGYRTQEASAGGECDPIRHTPRGAV